MTAVPQPEKITAEEYFRLTENAEERTELLDGQIVAMAGASDLHQLLVMRISHVIDGYILGNKGDCNVRIAPYDVVLDEYNIPQPDVFVVFDPSKLDGKRCNGAPDWIVEVLSTNRDNDLIHKHGLYKSAGVREYWIVDPKNEKTLVYFFERNDLPDIYTFDTPIPVEIYDRKLSIRISDLL